MARIESCLKCGTGPAGAGGICTACAMKANLPKMLDDTKNSFGLTAKVWQGNDNTNDTTDPKNSYSFSPIIKDTEIQKRAKPYHAIDGLVKPNNSSNKTSINYIINPNIDGYILSFSRRADNKYIFNLTSYNIRLANAGFNKDVSKSYGLASKSNYFSANTYAGATAPNYVSTSSGYSGKSSSGAISGSKK